MSDQKLIAIAKYGTYYYPAHKHYKRIVPVVCDSCGAKPLKACIGYGESDLCLTCANTLVNSLDDDVYDDEPMVIQKPLFPGFPPFGGDGGAVMK